MRRELPKELITVICLLKNRMSGGKKHYCFSMETEAFRAFCSDIGRSGWKYSPKQLGGQMKLSAFVALRITLDRAFSIAFIVRRFLSLHV